MAAARSARTGAVNVFVKIGIGARIDSTRPPAELVHDAVAEPFHELRTEFESLLAALEERHRGPVVSQHIYAGSVLAWALALTVRRREVLE